MQLFIEILGLFDALIRAMLGIEFFGIVLGLFVMLVGVYMIFMLRNMLA